MPTAALSHSPRAHSPSRTRSARDRTRSETVVRVPCLSRTHRIRLTGAGLYYLNHSMASFTLGRLLEEPPDGCAAIHAALDHFDHAHELDQLPEAVRAAFDQEADQAHAWVHQEWQGLWHNARLADLPYDDHEAELFWDCLGDAVRDACKDLSDEIDERWGVRLSFYQYGRSGATIAPSDWMGYSSHGAFGSFNDEVLDSCCAVHVITSALTAIDVIRYIDRYWRTQAASITAWWTDERQYLELHRCC